MAAFGYEPSGGRSSFGIMESSGASHLFVVSSEGVNERRVGGKRTENRGRRIREHVPRYHSSSLIVKDSLC